MISSHLPRSLQGGSARHIRALLERHDQSIEQNYRQPQTTAASIISMNTPAHLETNKLNLLWAASKLEVYLFHGG